jgi:hypothetical protein
VLLDAISDGLSLLTWEQDAFAFADSYDEAAGRYRGLRGGQRVTLVDTGAPVLLVKPEVARRQLDAERVVTSSPEPPAGGKKEGDDGGRPRPGPSDGVASPPEPKPALSKRYHGTVTLDATRVGRDASLIADEVIAHLAALVGSKVTVTLEIEAEMPNGAPEQVVRIVTENSRTLKFTSQGFERE